MRTIEPALSNKVYDILIAECGAKEYWRENFVHCFQEGCQEYRIQGSLGFGGKFRNNSNGVYVDMYPEDETPERLEAARKATALIKELFDEKC